MAFLDNSGDIILDAVLTDAGRQRLARGDGSFRITKFALGDDEINYGLYDKNHPSGSAYFDLEIMQTPVFEAFTNNIASLNSRLTSFSRTNLLYLPVLKINNLITPYTSQKIVQNGYVLAVDEDTATFFTVDRTYDTDPLVKGQGILNGINPSSGKFIRIDQGIDSKEYPVDIGLDSDLKETQYLIEIDNKFANLVSEKNETVQPSFIDDDDIAAYYVSSGDVPMLVEDNTSTSKTANEVIDGARGTTLKFRLKSSIEVSTSDYLFEKLGTDVSSKFGVTDTVRTIVTSVRITGLTTGYAVDIPLVLVKVS